MAHFEDHSTPQNSPADTGKHTPTRVSPQAAVKRKRVSFLDDEEPEKPRGKRVRSESGLLDHLLPAGITILRRQKGRVKQSARQIKELLVRGGVGTSHSPLLMSPQPVGVPGGGPAFSTSSATSLIQVNPIEESYDVGPVLPNPVIESPLPPATTRTVNELFAANSPSLDTEMNDYTNYTTATIPVTPQTQRFADINPPTKPKKLSFNTTPRTLVPVEDLYSRISNLAIDGNEAKTEEQKMVEGGLAKFAEFYDADDEEEEEG